MRYYDVLIGCECSGTVRDAFRRRGINAISCDILNSVTPGPHIRGSIYDVDMRRFLALIAFPPCTYFTRASAWMWRSHKKEQEEALKLVNYLWRAPVRRGLVALENPPGCLPRLFRPYDHIVNPFYFGHQESKYTCLWLKGFPPLMSTLIHGEPKSWVGTIGEQKNRAYIRSKTFTGVAEAMANQWSYLLR